MHSLATHSQAVGFFLIAEVPICVKLVKPEFHISKDCRGLVCWPRPWLFRDAELASPEKHGALPCKTDPLSVLTGLSSNGLKTCFWHCLTGRKA